MTTYKWEPFDEDIARMARKTVIRNPHVSSEEEEIRDDMGDHDPSEWGAEYDKRKCIEEEE